MIGYCLRDRTSDALPTVGFHRYPIVMMMIFLFPRLDGLECRSPRHYSNTTAIPVLVSAAHYIRDAWRAHVSNMGVQKNFGHRVKLGMEGLNNVCTVTPV